MISPIPATCTARDVAAYILDDAGLMPFARLQSSLFTISQHTMLDCSTPLFNEPFIATRRGPLVKSVSVEWLRHYRASTKRRARRLPALRRRVKLWCLQENDRTGSKVRLRHLNVPGGWGPDDDTAIRQGVRDYYVNRLLGKGTS
jgi:uncharacterized phage-associated protein